MQNRMMVAPSGANRRYRDRRAPIEGPRRGRDLRRHAGFGRCDATRRIAFRT